MPIGEVAKTIRAVGKIAKKLWITSHENTRFAISPISNLIYSPYHLYISTYPQELHRRFAILPTWQSKNSLSYLYSFAILSTFQKSFRYSTYKNSLSYLYSFAILPTHPSSKPLIFIDNLHFQKSVTRV